MLDFINENFPKYCFSFQTLSLFSPTLKYFPLDIFSFVFFVYGLFRSILVSL
jgi:hypothetical protein